MRCQKLESGPQEAQQGVEFHLAVELLFAIALRFQLAHLGLHVVDFFDALELRGQRSSV